MKLLLVAPSSGKWQHIGRHTLFNGRAFRFSLLSLLSVAALTPPDWEITLVDEQIENVPLDGDWDLVGLTCMTALAPRAYQLADAFRARGIPVVLGGMHPTFMPDEALQHADAVVVGDAEGAWHRVLDDLRAGRLAGKYEGGAPSLAGLPPIPRQLLNRHGYSTVQAVQATRGCPRPCRFCSISAFSSATQRQRPAHEVAAEVAKLPERFVIFVDDNLTANRDYALQLFRALEPLNKLWVTQTTLRFADDSELVHAAARAGCCGVFVGLETISQQSLKGVFKAFNHVESYRTQVDTLHRAGIGVEAGLVFGLDGHTPAIFRETLDTIEALHIDAVQVSIATPLPGTQLYNDWKDRLITHDWARYDLHQAVFNPTGMTATDLEDGHDWFTAQYYRPWRIARRMARWITQPRGFRTLPYALGLNVAYHGRVRRWNLIGRDPALTPSRPPTPATCRIA